MLPPLEQLSKDTASRWIGDTLSHVAASIATPFSCKDMGWRLGAR
jgi:hypothetical protein